MKENMHEKSLDIKRNQNVFSKIKHFFKNMFGKKEEITPTPVEYVEKGQEESIVSSSSIEKTEEKESTFLQTLNEQVEGKKEENKEGQDVIENLQKRFENGEVKEEELTKEEIQKLRYLYHKQIQKLAGRLDIYKKDILAMKEEMIQYREQAMAKSGGVESN